MPEQLKIRNDLFIDLPNEIVPVPAFRICPAQNRPDLHGEAGPERQGCDRRSHGEGDVARFALRPGGGIHIEFELHLDEFPGGSVCFCILLVGYNIRYLFAKARMPEVQEKTEGDSLKVFMSFC